ncbi:DUF305 domain-containing protein [Planococcus faecalis]
MALIMASVMVIVMLLFMWPMYKNKKTNTVILGGSAVIFALSLWLVRSQLLVEDVNLTSERANISDPRVRELADSIIEAQRKEIAEMKKLIKDLEDEE